MKIQSSRTGDRSPIVPEPDPSALTGSTADLQLMLLDEYLEDDEADGRLDFLDAIGLARKLQSLGAEGDGRPPLEIRLAEVEKGSNPDTIPLEAVRFARWARQEYLDSLVAEPTSWEELQRRLRAMGIQLVPTKPDGDGGTR